MELTIYLLKTDVNSFDAAFDPDAPPPEPIGQGAQGDCAYRIYLLDGEERPPGWRSFVEAHVGANRLEATLNRTYSMLIVLSINTPTGERYFAIPFGNARFHLNATLIEPSFGLKTTLNSIDENSIRTVDSKRPGVKTFQRREVSNLSSAISEFTFEFDSEVIRLVEGICSDMGLGRKIGGADALHLSVRLDFTGLGSKCQELYTQYLSDAYRRNFEFIDYVSPVREPVRQNELNIILAATVGAKYAGSDIAMSYPDQIDYARCCAFRIRGLRKVETVDDLSLPAVYAYIGERAVTPDNILDTIRICGVDADGQPVTPEEPLYAYLVFQTEVGGNQYIMHSKHWYVVNTNFLTTLHERLERSLYPYLGPDLQVWPAGVHEGPYNTQYGHDPDFLVLDQRNFIAPGTEGHGRIEIADLFHRPSKRLFFVKDPRDSAKLSHLFSQASVSAELFKDWPLYKSTFLEKANVRWPDRPLTEQELDGLTFVYAIKVQNDDDALTALPFFSKVNLLRHLKRIRVLGYRPELIGISTR